MKLFQIILTLAVLCNLLLPIRDKHPKAKAAISIEETGSNIDTDYKEVDKSYLDTLLKDICSTEALEFKGLYQNLDSIASDRYEKLALVDSLKKRGFRVTNWGRGNWEFGPRIVSLDLSKETCVCQVDKLYYTTQKENEYRVTERIKCE